MKEKGFTHVLVVSLLLAGIGVAAYLVQQQTNLFPKAAVSRPIGPTTCKSNNDCPLGYQCQIAAAAPQRYGASRPIIISGRCVPVASNSGSTSPGVVSCSACRADIDQSGQVNISDFGKLMSCMGKSVSGSCQRADVNGDGQITTDDLSCVKAQYLKKCSSK